MMLFSRWTNIQVPITGMKISYDMQGGKVIDDDYVYAGGPLWDGVSYVQDKPSPEVVKQ